MAEKFRDFPIKEHYHPVKLREKKYKIKSKLVFLCIFVIFTLSLLLFLRSPYFTIRHIYIEGLDKLTREELYSAGGIGEGMNTWKLSPPALREKILQLPRVAGVEVNRILPGELYLIIREKYPLVLIPFHGYYLEVAEDGMIIGLRDDYRGELPLISGLLWGKMDVGMQIPDRGRGEIIDAFLGELSQTPALPLAEINVSDPEQIIVYTWEGMEVWLGDGTDLGKKMEVLLHIYSHYPSMGAEGYLDLRTAEAPVLKPLEK